MAKTRFRRSTVCYMYCLLLAWVRSQPVLFFPSACSATTTSSSEGDDAVSKRSYLERTLSGVTRAAELGKSFLVGEGPRQKRSPKRIEVAVVGFGRTGTTSMAAALTTLGYTFQHDDTLPEISDILGKLYDEDDASFAMDDFVEEVGRRGFDSIFFFTDDFLQWAANDDRVKVVLTTRDNGRKWAESWVKIAPNIDHAGSRPFVWSETVRGIYPHFDLIYRRISTLGQPEKYKDLDALEAAYDAHLIKVRSIIPADRLLEFNVKEGWGPLCHFLDKPVPEDTDFPHVNDRVVAEAIVATLGLITWIWPLGPALVVVLLWKILRMCLLPSSTPSTTGKKKD